MSEAEGIPKGHAGDPSAIRERIVWRAAVLMLLAVTGWLYYTAFQAVERADALEGELQAATAALEEPGVVVEPQQRGLDTLGLSTAGVRRLEAAGLNDDPERFLVGDLSRLIGPLLEERADPRVPVQLAEERTVVLSDRWVYAVFEGDDGRGAAIVEHLVDREGRLQWRLVAVTGPGEFD